MRIGELAAAAGTTTKALRFYEQAGLLLPPQRTPAGYRDYTDAAVSRLDFVRRGQAAGLTLAQIRQVLEVRDAGQAPCQHVVALLDRRLEDLDAQLAELRTLRNSIAGLRARAGGADERACPEDQVCRYL
ncbi:heavy metal-responsive transcriptional regulator [Phycicoccus sp. Soil802]|uniref:heavy metal-responsive transcriptional regulator n=1 Tax=Phycicoccus sp. Soil802 TaxID=1736414 RepID=UPI000702F3CF|nr:heavy metal-responsive transcriptional regulator [Phycicoccus sp. Soil802]KRF29005.1 MerR family transcriptional regulator [Phycicoccus sp. Soil802]